ncbi:uncharacterized protein LOC142161765 [Nicotiana tabacum]|uniref:Uncharacterized protein LOC142161765 n=1 Tax=Nicotiana tabacum TaxID=4097 RepID=A0AC58UCK2_TOBAC
MKFLLEISARLNHTATMVPNGGADDENMPHFFKLRCQNCQELSKRQCVYISESVQHGRDTVNHVIRCKECKKYGTVTLIPRYGRPFTAEDSESGAYAPLLLFDCDEMAPEGYEFNGAGNLLLTWVW